jgi:hypothetical protein
MKTIKSLEGRRLFIWVIVAAVAVLGGLTVYIYSVSQGDNFVITAAQRNLLKNMRENEFTGTTWSPNISSWDAVMAFNRTKKNDPQHLYYDYSFASDSQAREIGYWQIINNRIILTPTKVITSASQITTITPAGQNLLVHFYYESGSALFAKNQ